MDAGDKKLGIRGRVDLALRALRGAFDTPISRRKHRSEYANDARARLRDLAKEIEEGQTVFISKAALGLALNCLDRDAEDGKVIRAEIAALVRADVDHHNKPVPKHTDLGDWLN